jgi:lipoic acid synthetase
LLKHYHPDEFHELKEIGQAKGIPHVEAGPLVRSSYHAQEQVEELLSADPTNPFPLI